MEGSTQGYITRCGWWQGQTIWGAVVGMKCSKTGSNQGCGSTFEIRLKGKINSRAR